jgi:hypothetical protein
MRMTQKMGMGQIQIPEQKLPAMKMTMRMTTTDVQPNGDFTTEFAITDAGVLEEGNNPQIAAMLKAQLKTLVGLSGRSEMTNRGFVKSMTFDTPPGMSPMAKQQIESMRNSMHQMVSPLPEEPVGAGAQWKVDQRIVSGGMILQQTTTMTVKSMSGDNLELAAELSQTADPQDVSLPGVPPGTVAHLNSFTGKGEGTMRINLRSPTAPQADITSTSDVAMTITAGGQTNDMTQHLELTMTWQEAKASESKPATTKPASAPGAP